MTEVRSGKGASKGPGIGECKAPAHLFINTTRKILFLRELSFLVFFLLITGYSYSQTKGIIYKPAEGTGAQVLDPNLDGYSSTDSQGFILDDEEESEIPYTPIPSVGDAEPDSDLGPGPDCKFTDLVKSEDNHTIYAYFDSSDNLMFRFRLGGTANNSKGYSILIDTDQKFGASGANADPDYIPGNPGFEIEVVLRTNFGVGLYDVNGRLSPIEIGKAETDRPYESFSQKSVAWSEICGDNDYFYDFYIPFSQITAAFPAVTPQTPLRFVGNSVINPKAATGNNGISDLGGIDDRTGDTDNLWEELIDVFPPTSPEEIGDGGSLAPRASCPSITGPIALGATSINGTSAEVDGATIELYRDGTAIGTTVVNAGSWVVNGISPTLVNESFYATASVSEATATATGTLEKSVSYIDCNSVLVGATCSDAPTGIAEAKGNKIFTFTTTATGPFVLTVYNADGDRVSSTSPNPMNFAATDAREFIYTEMGNKIPAGVYYFSITEPGKCESAKTVYCNTGSSSASPGIDDLPVIETATAITGTATPGATITLFVNDMVQASTVAVGGNWSFSTASLASGRLYQGDVLAIRSMEAGSCEATTTTQVGAVSYAPVITEIFCTSSMVSEVSGSSAEDPGASIFVYQSSVLGDLNPGLVGTTTVSSTGHWSLTGLSLAPGTFIRAKAQTTGEILSPFSGEVQITSKTLNPLLEITSTPIAEGDAAISGILSPNTGADLLVQLYIDGVAIDGATTTVPGGSGSWTISDLDVPFSQLYAGGIASVTVTEVGNGSCESDFSNEVVIDCRLPQPQRFSATGPTVVCEGGTISFQIDDTEEMVVYELIDQNGISAGPAKLGRGTAITLTTAALSPLVTAISIKAQRIGISCETLFSPSIPIIVNPAPEITIGSNPVGNPATTTVILGYTAASGEPDSYVLDFDATANALGFADITTPAGLPESNIRIDIPPSAASTYFGTLTVINSVTGCMSAPIPFNIRIAAPTETAVFTINEIPELSVVENSPYAGNTPILSGDPPIGLITYTLSGTDASLFSPDPATGVVSMAARDFEVPEDANVDNVYEVTLTATDENGNFDRESWTLTVTDVAESTGFNIEEIADASLAENSPYTGPVPVLSGSAPTGVVTYMLGGADAGQFSIDSATGVVSMLAQDYERPQDGDADNIYELSITATDESGSFDTEAWNLIITDKVETVLTNPMIPSKAELPVFTTAPSTKLLGEAPE